MMGTRSQGFSLLELLVVLALLGTVVGMAGLVLGRDPQRQAVQEARLFMQLLQHARQQAVLDGRETGLRLTRNSYQLMTHGESGWVAAGPLQVVDQDLRLFDEDRLATLDADPVAPQLVARRTDEYSAFTLLFEVAGVRLVTLTSDGLNDPALGH